MAKGSKDADEAADDPDPLLLLVGTRIRAIRKRAKMSQSVLGETIGTHPTYMVGVEAGTQNITLKTLGRIASALGVSPMILLLEGELAIAADAGKLAEFETILRAAFQHTDEMADLLRRALEMVSARTSQPAPAAATEADETGL